MYLSNCQGLRSRVNLLSFPGVGVYGAIFLVGSTEKRLSMRTCSSPIPICTCFLFCSIFEQRFVRT